MPLFPSHWFSATSLFTRFHHLKPLLQDLFTIFKQIQNPELLFYTLFTRLNNENFMKYTLELYTVAHYLHICRANNQLKKKGRVPKALDY